MPRVQTELVMQDSGEGYIRTELYLLVLHMETMTWQCTLTCVTGQEFERQVSNFTAPNGILGTFTLLLHNLVSYAPHLVRLSNLLGCCTHVLVWVFTVLELVW